MQGGWVAVFLVLAGGPAWAAPEAVRPSQPTADRRLEAGIRWYRAQKYAEAIAEFQAGYQLDPRPEFLYALAQAQRLSGNCKAALVAYQAFLGTSPSEAQATEAQQHIEQCRAAEPPPVAVVVPPPSPAPSPELVVNQPPATRPVLPWVVGGAAVAALGVGAGLRISTQSEVARLEHSCRPGCPPSSWEALPAREWVGNGLMILGAALAVADAVIFWRTGVSRPSVLSPAPGGLAATVTF
jgi:hypothetical protein